MDSMVWNILFLSVEKDAYSSLFQILKLPSVYAGMVSFRLILLKLLKNFIESLLR